MLAGGYDFYASPSLSADGGRLAWVCWNHPNMPWDDTELWTAAVAPDGSLSDKQKVRALPLAGPHHYCMPGAPCSLSLQATLLQDAAVPTPAPDLPVAAATNWSFSMTCRVARCCLCACVHPSPLARPMDTLIPTP